MKLSYWENRLIQMQNELLDPSIEDMDSHLIRLYKSSLEKNKKDLVELYNTLFSEGEVKINDLYRYNRYWQVRSDLNKNLMALGEKEQKIFDDRLLKMYENVQTYFNANPKYYAVTKRGIVKEKDMPRVDLSDPTFGLNGKYVVNSIWCGDGKHWSDRIWDNQQALAEDLEKGLFDIVSRGVGPEGLAHEIERKYDKSYNKAKTLVRTELAHIYNAAALDRYKMAGIEIVRVVCATEIIRRKGNKTVKFPCVQCKEHDGKQYNMLSAVEGTDIPLFHTNCRCTIVPVI